MQTQKRITLDDITNDENDFSILKKLEEGYKHIQVNVNLFGKLKQKLDSGSQFRKTQKHLKKYLFRISDTDATIYDVKTLESDKDTYSEFEAKAKAGGKIFVLGKTNSYKPISIDESYQTLQTKIENLRNELSEDNVKVITYDVLGIDTKEEKIMKDDLRIQEKADISMVIYSTSLPKKSISIF